MESYHIWDRRIRHSFNGIQLTIEYTHSVLYTNIARDCVPTATANNIYALCLCYIIVLHSHGFHVLIRNADKTDNIFQVTYWILVPPRWYLHCRRHFRCKLSQPVRHTIETKFNDKWFAYRQIQKYSFLRVQHNSKQLLLASPYLLDFVRLIHLRQSSVHFAVIFLQIYFNDEPFQGRTNNIYCILPSFWDTWLRVCNNFSSLLPAIAHGCSPATFAICSTTKAPVKPVAPKMIKS